MKKFTELKCDLIELKSFANSLALKAKIGDIYLLNGDLGVGKTTFSRFFINSLHTKSNIQKPDNIKSPSFPIMINYPLLNYEINHYDLYRLTNKNELTELGFLENLQQSLTIIEWPDLIIDSSYLDKYCFIEFKFIDENKRLLRIHYTEGY